MREHYTSSWKWLEKLLLRVAESRSVNWQISLIFLFQQINHPEHNKHQSVQLTNEYKKYLEVDEGLTQQMFHVFHHIFHFFMFEIWCWVQNIFFLIQIRQLWIAISFSWPPITSKNRSYVQRVSIISKKWVTNIWIECCLHLYTIYMITRKKLYAIDKSGTKNL